MTEADRLAPPHPGELPWVLAGVSDGAARKALNQLSADYEARGLRLLEDNQRYQLGAAPAFAKYIENMLGTGPGQRLTRAALETLTIIAYKQPCTRAEIEAIRGVNSDRQVALLEQRGLVENIGTGEGPGRPKLYRTTMRFLEHFGIRSPRELPPLPDAPPEPLVEAEI
jgi:segregation and condensation protein B